MQITSEQILRGIANSPEDAEEAWRGMVTPDGYQLLRDDFPPLAGPAIVMGFYILQWKNPLATASKAELEYIASCIRLANEVVPVITGEAAIITDGILGRIQMAVDRA